MTVNQVLPVSVSIAASANPVCPGTLVAYTAAPVNGGTNPIYQWKVNGSVVLQSSSATYSFVPANGNTITCVVISSATCTTGNPATSNTITMTVNQVLPVSVSIAASANPVCAGSPVTFTSTSINGGTTPSYQWKVNAVNVTGATNASYSFNPANNDAVSCVVTSSATCTAGSPATSNTLTMTVNPVLPVSVSIAASATTVCAGTYVTYTASPVNGGANPGYQWRVNNVAVTGATNAAYTFNPANNDAITCILTSNAACTTGNPATSNTVIMTVDPVLQASVSITASANPVCAGTLVTFTAVPVNGGATPIYQWLVNGSTVAIPPSSTYSFIPANGNTVTCVMTSGANCTTGNPATSNTVTMTVNPVLPVSVTINASANPVAAGTSVTFTATPVNGGSAPAYQWKVDAASVSGATTSTYTFVPVNGNTVTCVLTSNAACTSGNPAASNSVVMSVSSIGTDLVLQNLNITGTQCFNATQTITVAGGITTFTVQSGGSATMIAGQKISYLPGTRVMSGGYMHGYITTTGQYCGVMSPSIASVIEGTEDIPATGTAQFFKVYPNPTDGDFVLELSDSDLNQNIRVEIYSMTGNKVLTADLPAASKHYLTLAGKSSGVYLIQVVSGKNTGTTRIIRR
jgi:hypothetical protein